MILTDNDPMPWGKHKGTEMANVPANYLLFLWNKWGTTKPFGDSSQAVKNYIADNLDALKEEQAKQTT